MDSTDSLDFPPPEDPQDSPRARGSTLYFLRVVFSVAFVVATLFTLWTPVELLPVSMAGRLARAFSPLSLTPSPLYPSPTPRPLPRLGLVAGHWGNDSGAVCDDGLTEAEINLSVATKVKAILAAQGYQVDILREFDLNLTGYRALALVSIHADSCVYINDEAKGFKVAAALSNPYPEKAARLIACLSDRYHQATEMEFHAGSVTRDMTSYHAFDEIHSETTAAIIETGFMNLDRQKLTQEQDTVARGIAEGILCFLNNESVFPTPPSP